jgi:TatD DNase family protein
VSVQLIDIGVNLTHDAFDRDRAEVIARAESAGVVQMIVTGASLASTRKAIELAQTYPGRLFATAGIHPHHARELDEAAVAALAELAAQPAVVAIGECGLDYFRDYSPRDVQRRAFEQQLALAERLAKPVFLHQRDAHEDFIAILGEHRRALPGAVAHCFTGTRRELEACLELELAIGITGWICDERRGTHLVPLMREIPAARLMIETDAPYLLPRDLQQKPASRRNEPMYLAHVAGAVARASGVSLASLAASTSAAARALFALPGAKDKSLENNISSD